MASESIQLYSSSYPHSSPYTLTATIVENSHDDINNTSNITITATITSGGVHFSQYWTPTLNVYYKDNNSKTSYGDAKASEQINAITSSKPSASVSWTGNVAHKADGTLSVTVKAEWLYKSSGTGLAPVTGSVECTLAMTTIMRAGTVSLSATNVNLTTANNSNVITATVTPQNSAFYHRVTATLGGTSVMTAVWAEDSSNKAYIKDRALLTALGNNTAGTVTVTVTTYSTKSTSGTVIGTKTASATITVDTSAIKPTLSATSISIKTTPISGYLVAGYSTANVNATVAAGYGSTSCTTTVTLSRGTMATASASGTGAKTLATNAMASSTDDYTLTATITAKDGRGATATATATYTVKGYTQPAVSITAYRVDANGSTTADEAGPYAYIAYAATAKSIGNNSIQSMTATYSGSVSGTLSGSPSWVAITDSQGITITVTAADRVTSTTLNAFVSVSTFPLDLYQDGDDIRVGIAKVPETANWVDSALNMGVRKADTTEAVVRARNSHGWVNLDISSANKRGIWDSQTSSWLVYKDEYNISRMPSLVMESTSSSATSYTLSRNSGQVIYLWASADMTVTVPSDLPVGWYCVLCCGYYLPTINASGSDKFNVSGAKGQLTSIKARKRYSQIGIYKTATTQFSILMEDYRGNTIVFGNWRNLHPYRTDSNLLYVYCNGVIRNVPSANNIYSSGTVVIRSAFPTNAASVSPALSLTPAGVYQREDALEITFNRSDISAIPSGAGLIVLDGTLTLT